MPSIFIYDEKQIIPARRLVVLAEGKLLAENWPFRSFSLTDREQPVTMPKAPPVVVCGRTWGGACNMQV